MIFPKAIFSQSSELYRNEKESIPNRVTNLLSQLSIEEKVSLLRATSPGIPRLNIDKYYHGNEALHGVVRPGYFTVFSSGDCFSSHVESKSTLQNCNSDF